MKCFPAVDHKTFSSTLKPFYVSLIEKVPQNFINLPMYEICIFIKATKEDLEVAFIDSTNVEAACNIVNTLGFMSCEISSCGALKTLRTYLHSFWHSHFFLIIDILFSHYLLPLVP